MRRSFSFLGIASLAIVALVACGDSKKATPNDSTNDSTPDTRVANNTPLPAECTLPPYIVHAVRDGGLAAGSPTFEVIGAAAVQIPLVPDKDQVLTDEQSYQMSLDTDLLGYGLIFGDEQFGVDDVSLFGGYTPEAAGKSRGLISIYPSTTTPLAVGDVVTGGLTDELGMYTTLTSLGMDFKATPDEFFGYANSIEGSVTILGLNDEAICLDVDLSWGVSDFSTGADGILTIQGIFTAPLADRTLPLG